MTRIVFPVLAASFWALAINASPAQTTRNAIANIFQGNGQNCLTRFHKYPEQFSKCIDQVCFLFVQDSPYIQLDPSMQSENDQILFKCNAPSSAFPLLQGVAFSIHNATSTKEALCVWAGAGCSFNDLTTFISEQSVAHSNYQFAASGLLLESPLRISSSLYPSSSILDSQLVIIGPRDDFEGTSSPLKTLLRPYRRETWIMFCVILSIFFALGLLIIFVFTPETVRWHALFLYFMGDPIDGDDSGRSSNTNLRCESNFVRNSTDREVAPDDRQYFEETYSNYKAALSLFQAALYMLLLIFILFYEIAVVNFMFMQHTKPKVKNIKHLSAPQLAKYAVLKESNLEYVWQNTVDPFGFYNYSSFPWYRCHTAEDCFDKILDPTHRAKLVVTFESFGNYQMLKRDVCNKLTTYESGRRLYSFGAGWLFGSAVKPSIRRTIDRNILDLRVTDRMRNIMEKELAMNGEMKCRARISRIGWKILGLAVLVLVGPSLALLIALLCVARYTGAPRSSRANANDWIEICPQLSTTPLRRRRTAAPSS